MWNKLYLVFLVYSATTLCFTNSLPRSISSHNYRYRRAYIYDVNGIDHQDETNSTSSEELGGILLLEENTHRQNPWDTLVLSLRNGFAPTDIDRRRFSHFYKRKPGGVVSNNDPIVFPTESEAESVTHAISSDIEAATTKKSDESTGNSDNSAEDEEPLSSSSSSTSSAETEIVSSTPENEKPMGFFTTWLWETLKPASENRSQSTAKPEFNLDDIGTQSLYHGPKIKKGRGKIVCPPGQRPNHFGECKCPITLKQSDYE